MTTTNEKPAKTSLMERGRIAIREKLEKRIARAIVGQTSTPYNYFTAYGENERDLLLSMGWEVLKAPTTGLTQAIRAPWVMKKQK